MGEAKRQEKAYQKARNDLFASSNEEARIVGKTATALFDGFILPNRFTGGCYITTMVLHLFLKREYEIDTKPVVGFVNDGTDNIMISHAWLEYEKQKTDLTLHVTERPDIQLQGPLLVLDRVLRPGRVTYSYHLTRPPEGILALQEMHASVVARKELEHQQMLARAANEELLIAYVDGAPPHLGYHAMTAALRTKLVKE